MCSVDTCDREAATKGMCKPHYMKSWRYGDPVICMIEGCEEDQRANGLCKQHYDKLRDGRRQRTYVPKPRKLEEGEWRTDFKCGTWIAFHPSNDGKLLGNQSLVALVRAVGISAARSGWLLPSGLPVDLGASAAAQEVALLAAGRLGLEPVREAA